jgi:glycosyltransferase involved in cell wall biosynthesis
MKIAIIHDWLVSYAGSERVVEQMLGLYPDADLYSLVDFLPDQERHGIFKKARTSFIQRLPIARNKYRSYLPLMPFAVERFDLSSYDLILSSSHAVAKGVRKRPGQLHICYCHTPMRYAWDLRDQYLSETGLDRGIKGIMAKFLLERIRRWDLRTSSRVDYFVANSRYIADRIRRAYGRESTVIYPPVDTDRFTYFAEKEDFYLSASRMVPYKKMDLIVEAFSSMQDKCLIVLGDGPDFEKIRARAGRNVRFLGYQTGDALRDLMQRAKAFIFAAEEDFGIVPVEAQACGTPVIAFGRGGVTETIVPLRNAGYGPLHDLNIGPTGVFFDEQTISSLIAAVQHFEDNRHIFDSAVIRKNAEQFSRERFRREYKAFVESRLSTRRS